MSSPYKQLVPSMIVFSSPKEISIPETLHALWIGKVFKQVDTTLQTTSAGLEPQLTCMREDVVGKTAKSVVTDGGHAEQGELDQTPLRGVRVPVHVHTFRHFGRYCKNGSFTNLNESEF